MNYNSDYFISSIRHLNECIGNYSKKIYKYYSDRTNVLLNKLENKIEELINQVELTLLDLFKQLNLYTDEPLNDMQSSEPRSVKEYYNSKILAIDQINFKNLLPYGLKVVCMYNLHSIIKYY